MPESWKFETKSVHAGYSTNPTTKALAVPICQTATYAFDSARHGSNLFDLKVPGSIYSNIMNTTNHVQEHRLSAGDHFSVKHHIFVMRKYASHDRLDDLVDIYPRRPRLTFDDIARTI